MFNFACQPVASFPGGVSPKVRSSPHDIGLLADKVVFVNADSLQEIGKRRVLGDAPFVRRTAKVGSDVVWIAANSPAQFTRRNPFIS